MKVVLLAGGLGTRLMEETTVRPKPMVEVGGKPMLWHIMSLYAAQGFDDFLVAGGYKREVIEAYFRDCRWLNGDLHIDFGRARVESRGAGDGDDWSVQVLDTGKQTQTGGRLLRLRSQLEDSGTFLLTYGDGIADVDLRAALAFHRRHGRIATLTAVRAPAGKPALAIGEGRVMGICQPRRSWVNGGFFIFEPRIFDYLSGDADSLEQDALPRVARDGELMAYKHEGFWQCMDTAQERDLLESLWRSGEAPWLREERPVAIKRPSRRLSQQEHISVGVLGV